MIKYNRSGKRDSTLRRECLEFLRYLGPLFTRPITLVYFNVEMGLIIQSEIESTYMILYMIDIHTNLS